METLNQREIKADTKKILIEAAVKVFADRGLDGASIKDLAEAAGVNTALISYHFGGKENLYKACLTHIGNERLEASERILKPAANKEEFKLRLKLFAEEIVRMHLQSFDACRILHRDFDSPNSPALEVFQDVFIRVFRTLHHFFESAQNSKLLKENLDCEIIAGIAFSALIHTARTDQLRKLVGLRNFSQPHFIDEFISSWVNLTCEGIMP